MIEANFIEESPPLVKRKLFWFLVFAFVCVSVFVLLTIRGLIPERIVGGSARLVGAFGPATSETGFDLSEIGLQPPDRPPTSLYSKLVGKHYTDESTGEAYIVLAIKHEASEQDLIILFNVYRSRNSLTRESDIQYGGDVILSPIALISWSDFLDLDSGKLLVSDVKATGFPKNCVLWTDLGTWMSLSYSYHAGRPCYSEESTMSIIGSFHSDFGNLVVDVTIRIEGEKFWFGEAEQEPRRYSKFGTAIKLNRRVSPDTLNERTEIK